MTRRTIRDLGIVLLMLVVALAAVTALRVTAHSRRAARPFKSIWP